MHMCINTYICTRHRNGHLNNFQRKWILGYVLLPYMHIKELAIIIEGRKKLWKVFDMLKTMMQTVSWGYTYPHSLSYVQVVAILTFQSYFNMLIYVGS